jgi:REP element-mobilizing transposase RayT
MTFDTLKHHHRPIRLKGYDYSQPGAYFVTTVIQGREPILGTIVDGAMYLSKLGQIVHEAWVDLPRHYTHIQLDEFCIMPNHVHGIIIILERVDRDKSRRRGGSLLSAKASLPEGDVSGEGGLPAQETRPYNRYSLSEYIRAFKSFSARRINILRKTPGLPVWQRNYFEHIIRNERELGRIRAYIAANPARWQEDEEYVE